MGKAHKGGKEVLKTPHNPRLGKGKKQHYFYPHFVDKREGGVRGQEVRSNNKFEISLIPTNIENSWQLAVSERGNLA